MKKSLFLTMLALSALVYSCKKDDDKSNAEKIQGKWSMVSYYDNDYYSNTNHRDTGTYATGAYTFEFTNNGKIYQKYNSWTDTSNYKVEGGNLIVDTYDTLQIKTLNGSDMQLYSKETYGSSSYYESTMNFKK
jgi:hypothetical protein